MAEQADMEDIGTTHRSGSPLNLALLAGAVGLFGLAYGADSVQNGSDILMPILASTFIMGGASQIAAEGILNGGGADVFAVLVGIALNLRFVALGLMVAPFMPAGRLR